MELFECAISPFCGRGPLYGFVRFTALLYRVEKQPNPQIRAVISPVFFQIRTAGVYLCTNQYFDYVVMLTIGVNCIFLAMTKPIEEAE